MKNKIIIVGIMSFFSGYSLINAMDESFQDTIERQTLKVDESLSGYDVVMKNEVQDPFVIYLTKIYDEMVDYINDYAQSEAERKQRHGLMGTLRNARAIIEELDTEYLFSGVVKRFFEIKENLNDRLMKLRQKVDEAFKADEFAAFHKEAKEFYLSEPRTNGQFNCQKCDDFQSQFTEIFKRRDTLNRKHKELATYFDAYLEFNKKCSALIEDRFIKELGLNYQGVVQKFNQLYFDTLRIKINLSEIYNQLRASFNEIYKANSFFQILTKECKSVGCAELE